MVYTYVSMHCVMWQMCTYYSTYCKIYKIALNKSHKVPDGIKDPGRGSEGTQWLAIHQDPTGLRALQSRTQTADRKSRPLVRAPLCGSQLCSLWSLNCHLLWEYLGLSSGTQSTAPGVPMWGGESWNLARCEDRKGEPKGLLIPVSFLLFLAYSNLFGY